jgi:hypothetical protein
MTIEGNAQGVMGYARMIVVIPIRMGILLVSLNLQVHQFYPIDDLDTTQVQP